MPLLKPLKALKSPTNQCPQLTSLTRARQPLRPQKALQLRLLKHKEQPTPPNHKAQLRLLKQKRRPKPAAQLKLQTCQCQPRNQNLLNLS